MVFNGLVEMATGLSRCMYCEDSMGTDIDHFAPKSTYPDRTFTWDNHFLACSHCNSNLKRAEFPVDPNGDSLLINPVIDDPRDHIVFTPSTGRFIAQDSKGEESIKVFGLQRQICVDGRRNAWTGALALVRDFVTQTDGGSVDSANACLRTLQENPFRAVYRELCILALRSNLLVPADVAKAICSRPELRV